MHTEKILIPLFSNDVAPRFDLATEVLIIIRDRESGEDEEKLIIMPRPSAEQVCHLILTEGVNVLICGGIEDEYYQYLTWKRVAVFDSVSGSWKDAFQRFCRSELESGDILCYTKS